MENISLFKNIPKEDIPSIIEDLECRRVLYKKDMTILSNLNNIGELGILVRGSASVIRIDYDGLRTIGANLRAGDIFGGKLSDYMSEEMSVVANCETEVLFVEYENILKLGRKNATYHVQIFENMIDVLTNKINDYSRRIEILNKHSTRDKILEFFHTLEITQGNHIHLPFNYTIMADYLAVDRSAMMREIKNLRDEGFIATNGHTITLIRR